MNIAHWRGSVRALGSYLLLICQNSLREQTDFIFLITFFRFWIEVFISLNIFFLWVEVGDELSEPICLAPLCQTSQSSPDNTFHSSMAFKIMKSWQLLTKFTSHLYFHRFSNSGTFCWLIGFLHKYPQIRIIN